MAIRLPALRLPEWPGAARGAVLKFKSTDGTAVEFSAGMMRAGGRIERVLMIRRGESVKDVTTIERSIGAGAGAALGMLGGPVMSVVGAGLGAAMAGRKSVIVLVVGEAGAQVEIKLAPASLESLELAAGVKVL